MRIEKKLRKSVQGGFSPLNRGGYPRRCGTPTPDTLEVVRRSSTFSDQFSSPEQKLGEGVAPGRKLFMETSNVLIGRERICAYLNIGRKMFRKLVDKGMPAQKIAGRWMAHKEVLDDFFRGYFLTDSPPAYGEEKPALKSCQGFFKVL